MANIRVHLEVNCFFFRLARYDGDDGIFPPVGNYIFDVLRVTE